MPIELNKGEFYIMQGDKCISLGEGMAETEFVESEDKSTPMAYNLNSSVELSGSIVNVNQDWLNDLITPSTPTNNFTMECNIPIMVQARWHKKTRINKKWFKRFGTKPDVVKCVLMCEYFNDAADDELDFEVIDIKYMLRPDQKRKGLMVEW